MEQLEPRTVSQLSFPYWKVVPMPSNPDKTIRMRARAFQNETIDLLPEDLERGERLGAFVGSEAEPEAVGGTPSFEAMSVPQLCVYLQKEEPTIAQLMELVGEDVALAERVLEAENASTGGKARKGLVSAINRLLGDDEGSDDGEDDEDDLDDEDSDDEFADDDDE